MRHKQGLAEQGMAFRNPKASNKDLASQSFPNSFTNWGPGIQTYEPVMIIVIQITT